MQPTIDLAGSHSIKQWRQRLAWLTTAARLNGLHLMGGPGSGKSRVIGRLIAWSDFVHGYPVILLEPIGPTIDNFLDKLIRLPYELRDRLKLRLPDSFYTGLWERIVYVDMSGKGAIVPFPLYHRHTPDESLFVTSQRFLDVLRRMDVALQSAPVEGWNALYKVGTFTGMILAALELPITEAEDLLRHPDRWKPRFEQAVATYPEVRPAVEFFREFAARPEQRSRRSDAWLTKILPFILDPDMAAMFGATTPGICWEQVVAKRQVVLLDFRHEQTFERRRFKLLWCFAELLEFLKRRGSAGRQQPVSLIVDEITQLLGFRTQEQAIMAEDIEELTSVVSRNYGVWLTISQQALGQTDERVRSALMRMGTQLIGVMPDPEDADALARQFLTYQPFLLKKVESVWTNLKETDAWFLQPEGRNLNGRPYEPMSERSIPFPVDTRTVEYTPEEQRILVANQFQYLKRFEFLLSQAVSEGNITGRLQKVSIASLDRGHYPDDALLAEARRRLGKRSGIPLATALAQIEQHQRRAQTAARKPNNQRAILTEEEKRHETDRADLPATDINPTDFWQ